MKLRALRFWWAWKHVARVMGDFQGRVLLTLFYFGITGPVALGARLASDPLHLRHHEGSAWLVREATPSDPRSARRGS